MKTIEISPENSGDLGTFQATLQQVKTYTCPTQNSFQYSKCLYQPYTGINININIKMLT